MLCRLPLCNIWPASVAGLVRCMSPCEVRPAQRCANLALVSIRGQSHSGHAGVRTCCRLKPGPFSVQVGRGIRDVRALQHLEGRTSLFGVAFPAHPQSCDEPAHTSPQAAVCVPQPCCAAKQHARLTPARPSQQSVHAAHPSPMSAALLNTLLHACRLPVTHCVQ